MDVAASLGVRNPEKQSEAMSINLAYHSTVPGSGYINVGTNAWVLRGWRNVTGTINADGSATVTAEGANLIEWDMGPYFQDNNARVSVTVSTDRVCQYEIDAKKSDGTPIQHRGSAVAFYGNVAIAA